MAFDPGSTSGDVVGFIKEHPLGIAVAVGGLILLFVLMGSGSSAPVATASTDDSATQAAAAIQAAQVGANTQTSLATISAGVTNNQTAAAQTVALATIQGQNDATAAAATASIGNAYYAAAEGISSNNTTAFVAGTQANMEEQIAGDQTIASEFGNLAGVLTSFGNNAQTITTNTNGAAVALGQGINSAGSPSAASIGQTPLLPIPNSGVTGGSPFANITSALLGQSAINSTVATNAGITAQNQANFNTGVALQQQTTAAQTAYATTGLSTIASGASNAISSMGGWLSGLFGAFTQSNATVKPSTPAPNATSLYAANASLLTAPTQFISATLSQF